VGFSVSVGQGTVPGIFLEYQGVGVNVSLSLPSVTPELAPILAHYTLPSFPVINNRAGAPGPSSPLYSVPLEEDVSIPALSDLSGTDPAGPDLTTIAPDIQTLMPNVNWGTLLAANNPVGRSWLEVEIQIAEPLLTADQLQQIKSGKLLPDFPEDLAKLVAAKAKDAATNNDVVATTTISSQAVEDTCSKDTWSNCGVAVKEALDRKPADPKAVVELAGFWGKAFDAQFDTLRQTGDLKTSTPDGNVVEAFLEEKVDPIEIAKDHAKDVMLKLWLKQFPTALKWVTSPEFAALEAYFEHQSSVATNYDELVLMNDVIQQEIAEQLEPFMKPTWQDQFSQAVDQAIPHWVPVP
jgi:hypothetical protein